MRQTEEGTRTYVEGPPYSSVDFQQLKGFVFENASVGQVHQSVLGVPAVDSRFQE